MTRRPRSLKAQMQEIERTIAERRNLRAPDASYRLETLCDVLATLKWLEVRETAIKSMLRSKADTSGRMG